MLLRKAIFFCFTKRDAFIMHLLILHDFLTLTGILRAYVKIKRFFDGKLMQ